MDQIKIGKFIQEKRKEQGLTQMQLAEALGITDRAVSKWETGRSLPDAAIMLELCKLLHITVNDLLNGEVVSMENYDKHTEEMLLEMVKQKELADKRLLTFEVVIGVVSTLFLAAMVAVGGWMLANKMSQWIYIVLFVVGFAQFIVCMSFALRIEQVAGYYECAKCGHRHVPTYASTYLAMHVGRTRFLKCPHCGKYSWQKKVIGKEEDK